MPDVPPPPQKDGRKRTEDSQDGMRTEESGRKTNEFNFFIPHSSFFSPSPNSSFLIPHSSLQSYPSLWEQAIGLTATLWRFVRSGFSIADKIERRRRRLICEGGSTGSPERCEKFDPAAIRCRACGCRVDMKPWLAAATCPLGKWNTIVEQATPVPEAFKTKLISLLANQWSVGHTLLNTGTGFALLVSATIKEAEK
jgi:hypothetical protein